MQRLAYTLSAIGVLVPLGWGLYQFAVTKDVPGTIRFSVPAAVVGMVLLVVVAVRDRMRSKRTEHFEEVT